MTDLARALDDMFNPLPTPPQPKVAISTMLVYSIQSLHFLAVECERLGYITLAQETRVRRDGYARLALSLDPELVCLTPEMVVTCPIVPNIIDAVRT